MKLRHRWQKVSLPNKLTVLVAIFAAFLAALQVGVAIFQVWLANEGSKDADKQAAKMIAAAERIAATADSVRAETSRNAQEGLRQSREALEQSQRSAQTSLEQAKRALDASIDLARTDQRPWLHVSGVVMSAEVAEGPLDLTLLYENSGKTPALNVQSRSYVSFTSADRSAFPTEWVTSISVFPHHRSSTGIRGYASRDAAESYIAGAARLNVVSWTCYQDIYGEVHVQQSCFSRKHGQDLSSFDVCTFESQLGRQSAAHDCGGYQILRRPTR
jgi:hypothetical protein